MKKHYKVWHLLSGRLQQAFATGRICVFNGTSFHRATFLFCPMFLCLLSGSRQNEKLILFLVFFVTDACSIFITFQKFLHIFMLGIAPAKGMSTLAKKTGIPRESLHQSFSGKDNSGLNTLKIADAPDYTLTLRKKSIATPQK